MASQNNLLVNSFLKYFSLKPFKNNKNIINVTSIRAFDVSTRDQNDKNNKIRENIISAIYNNKVPDDYYIISKWDYHRRKLFHFLTKLSDKKYVKVECKNKAGRGNNYDFSIKLFYEDGTTEEFMIELKFNVSSLKAAPQFVSPMKPSQYMTNSYEEYFYDNYLPQLSDIAQIQMPIKEEYLKQIHSNKPKCMKPFQELYYKGCKNSSQFSGEEKDIHFYVSAKKISSESIKSFINNTELIITSLSDYLFKTQQNKTYMLYSKKDIILQKINIDDYIIDRVVKNADLYRYECISKNGTQFNVLLRWKNGNGIAFPAFQIS